jgi:hypothetical protein
MLETKKPYLANFVYTSLGFILSLIAVFNDSRSILIALMLGLQVFLLYQKKLKLIKIFYIVQLIFYLLTTIGFYYIIADDKIPSLNIIIPVYIIFLSLVILSYLAVEHQIAKDGGAKENKTEKIMITLLSLVIIMIIFILINIMNPNQSEDSKNKIKEYVLYNCKSSVNNQEAVSPIIYEKFKLSDKKIELYFLSNGEKRMRDYESNCIINYKNGFFTCKESSRADGSSRNQEVNFDGERKFKMRSISEYSNQDFLTTVDVNCEAKLVK